MNFSETFGSGPFAAVNSSQAKDGFAFSIPSSTTLSPATSSVTIDDDQLMFSGVYKRDGSDLLISHDDRKVVVPDYFKGEARATLKSRDGATLTGDVVSALTGHVAYAQASASEPAREIGSVQKLTGTANAIRNGVSVQLNVGDKVYKGDVLESGSASALGVVFVDGTVFNLSSSARMVLNEMVYDPNGSSNSSLLSLVQGTITFVAGQTAKNGNMRVDTPVATMGIRGTTVLVKIGSADGRVQLSVERDPDGKVGSFVVYDKVTGQVIGTVSREGDKTIISPPSQPGQQATTESVQKTYAEKVADLQIVQQVFQAFFPEAKKDANPGKQGNGGSGVTDRATTVASNGNQGPTQTQGPTNGTSGPGGQGGSGPGGATVIAPPVNVSPFGDIQAPLNNFSNFFIADQVKPDPLIIPYITGTAQLTLFETDSPIPPGFSLAALITINKQTGQVSYNPQDFRFLGVGEIASFEITFQAQTGPYIVTKILPFTVDGINDVPIFDGFTPGGPLTYANFDAAVNEPLGTGSVTLFFKQGELTFTDKDFSDVAAGYTVSTLAVASLGETRKLPDTTTLLSFLHYDGITKAVGTIAGSIKETFSAPASTFDYLAKGETVSIVYFISVTDAHSATNIATLTVTITGTNDVPTITGATTVMSTTGAVIEDGALTTGGTITFQDVDLSDTHVATAVLSQTTLSAPLPGFNPATSQLVSFSVAVNTENTTDTNDIGTASWSYTLDNALAQALAKDQTITQVYTVTITDNNGATVTQPVTVTVTGTNDAPTVQVNGIPVGSATPVTTVDSGDVTEDEVVNGNLSAIGTIVFKDVDLIDTHTASVVLKSSDASVDLPGFHEGVSPTADKIGTFSLGSLANQNGDTNNIGLLGWTFLLDDNDPTLQSLATGQTITQVYTITITDNNGASVTRDVTIVIHGVNDGPNSAPTIIGSQTDALGAVVEDQNAVTLTDTGVITFQDIDLIDVHAISGSPLAPTSVTVNKGGLPGFNTGSDYVGALTLSLTENPNDQDNLGTVGWTFSVSDNDARVQALAKDQVITQNYTVTINDGHGGLATQIISVTITGVNDGPTIVSGSTTPTGGVTEEQAATLSTSGTITFQDIDLIDTHTATYVLKSSDATANLPGYSEVAPFSQIGTFALTAVNENAADTTNTGSVGWSFTLSNSNSVLQSLAEGQTLTQVYTVTVKDNNNATVTQDVTVTITGTNDRPVLTAVDVGGDVTEDTAVQSGNLLKDTGSIAFADIDLIDHETASVAFVSNTTTSGAAIPLALGTALQSALTLQTSAFLSNTGTINWSFALDNALVQYLAAGETVTATYTVKVQDNSGVSATDTSATQTVTVVISGTNDAPAISVVSANSDSDAKALDETNAGLTAAGTLSVHDTDITNTVAASVLSLAVSGTGASIVPAGTASALQAMMSVNAAVIDTTHTDGTINWSFNSGSEAFNFLAEGETLVLSYTLRATDSSGTPEHDDHVVTVTITGKNDGPVVAVADVTGVVTEAVMPSGNLTDTGSIAFTDLDLNDTHSITNIVPSAGALGTLTPTVTDTTGTGLGGVINWTYSVAAASVEYLASGDTKTETFTITLDDGKPGGTVNRTITVTITGTNDAPVVTGSTATLNSITEDDTANTGQTVGSFAAAGISDVDQGALKGIAITGFTASNGHWEYSTDAGAHWSQFVAYSATNALLLAASDKVRFVPDTQNGSTDTFTYIAWDQTSGANGGFADVSTTGGLTAFSNQSAIASLTVSAVNDAPAITSGGPAAVSFTENDAPLQLLPAATIADPDLITNYAGSSLDVTLTGTSSGDFLTMNNSIPGNPHISGANVIVNNVAVGTFSGLNTTHLTFNFNASSSPADVQTVMRSVVFFTLSDNPGANDRTATFTLSDGGNAGAGSALSATQAVTIHVTPVNDAPVATGTPSVNYSDTANDDTFNPASGTFAATDPDSATLTWGISGGASGSTTFGTVTYDFSKSTAYGTLFVKSTTGEWYFAPNDSAIEALTANDATSVTVTVSDGIATTNTSFAINLIGANDTPAVTSDGGGTTASVSIAENTTAVTTVIASDRDAGSVLTYAITGGADAGKFAIDTTTGALTFINAPDFETPASAANSNAYLVQVSASDGVASSAQTITVNVTDVVENHAPVLTDAAIAPATAAPVYSIFNGSHYSDVDGNNLSGIAIGAVNADPQTQGVWEYDLNGTWTPIPTNVSLTNAFALNYGYELRFVPVQNFSGSPAPTLTVYALDTDLGQSSGNGSPVYLDLTQPFASTHFSDPATLTVQSLPIAAADDGTTDEDADVTFTTQALTSNDSNPAGVGAALVITAVSGATHGTVDLEAGNVRFTPASNFSGIAGFDYTVSNGSGTATGHVTVDVAPVADAPTFTVAATTQGAEDTIVSLGDPMIDLTDIDGSETFIVKLSGYPTGATFSIGSAGTGADAGKWIIDPATTQSSAPLTMTPPPEFNGTFTLHVDAIVTDHATLTTGPLNDTRTFGRDIAVTVTPVADTFTGTAGPDSFTGFGGGDTFTGLDGFDRVSYAGATQALNANLALGTAVIGTGTADTLVNIEGVRGTAFNDSFDARNFAGDAHVVGTPIGFNEFEGRGGDDTIYALSNAQGATLTRVSYINASAGVTVNLATGQGTGTASGDVAGVGTDTFIGNVGNIIGSNFADVLIGSANAPGTVEVFDGRGGNDDITGGAGFDRVDYNNDPAATAGITVNLAAGTVTSNEANPANDRIGNDTLHSIEAVRGTVFDDYYSAAGFSGTSTNAGSNGTFNEFSGAGGDDTVIGNGNTRLSFNNSTVGVTVDLQAGTATGWTHAFSGVNAVQATMFDDTLRGSSTNDTFIGLAGNDSIDGRGGFDTASYNNIYYTTGGISVNMTTGVVTGDASSGTDTLRSIEQVQGTNFDDTYNAANFGFSGYVDINNNNVGNNGTFNQFEGLGGNDTITGNGNTRIVYFNATAAVSVDFNLGTAQAKTVDAGIGLDSFSKVNAAGTTGVNSAAGSAFNDDLLGSDTNGNILEVFDGRGGDDFINGRGGLDQVIYNSDPNILTGININLGSGTVASLDLNDTVIGHDTLRSIEFVIGTRFADTYDASSFDGTTSANLGSNGNFNEFQGLGGGDTITGNGNTRVSYANATSGVNADLSTGLATSSGNPAFGTDHFSFVNSLRGSAFSDVLTGNAGNNTLDGQAGNDQLDGLGGNDILIGGGGADQFIFRTGTGHDTINDFSSAAADKIDLTAIGPVSQSNFGTWYGSHASASGADTLIDLDATPAGVNTILVKGIAVTGLGYSDFILHA